MAIQAVLAAGAAIMAAVYAAIPDSVHRIAKEELMRVTAGDVSEYENEAIKAAFEKIGLDIDPEEGLTPQTITSAINAGPLAGTGIELTNIFDREACKRDLQRVAMARAAEAFGVKITDTSAEGLKASIKEEISRRVMEQLGEGAGDYLEAAPDLVELVRQLNAGIKAGLIDGNGNFKEPGLMMDEFHVNLRERQARYRAAHTRHWEPK